MYSKALFSFILTALSVASAHSKVCGDKNVFESTPLTLPSGDVIIMERFNCSNTAAGAERRASNVVERRHSFEVNPRDASQCTASNCKCGIACMS
ncbi:hypothetical protein BDN70DRAFT_886480 [Pholiota conissans]|uniref:Uncharacterized protein n=1 Tax=Pholiota conissans TaxID=109636 RepID=A0A9P5YSH0_9AGAR|nr:hypothetical protein BDN70DRAFT_886480 [Pholiota conissans]